MLHPFSLLRHTACLLCLLAVAACQSVVDIDDLSLRSAEETTSHAAQLQEGDSITLTATLDMPELLRDTRSVASISSLWLLVFDENHRYLYRAKALLPGQVENISGGTQLPAKGSAQDNKRRPFSVRLLSSTRPRIIHFVANYDFANDFPQDYLLKDTDEGQLINRLTDQNHNEISYWRVFKFNNLQTNTFANHTFLLLRNQAEVVIKNETNGAFQLRGFCLHNAPDRGTLAPYRAKATKQNDTADPLYSDVLYSFPTTPTAPTLLPGMQVQNQLGAVTTNTQAISTFEYKNSEADPDRQLCVIMYGQQRGQSQPGYYKIDLQEEVNDRNGNFLGSEPVDLVRNHRYTIRILHVDTKGYRTFEEAVKAPAGNNIFASIELKDFAEVSDGNYSLDVGSTEVVLVKPGTTYSTKINYNGTGATLNNVNIYYNRTPVAQAFANHPYIQSVTFNRSSGQLDIRTKNNLPEDETVTIPLVVIADNKDNRRRSKIQRVINVSFRQPYKFNAKFVAGPGATNNKRQSERINLTFTVPASLPAPLFPYTVLIEANGISPYVDAQTPNQVKVIARDKKIYYEYVVKNATPGQRRTETLYFKRVHTGQTVSATLTSALFADETVSL